MKIHRRDWLRGTAPGLLGARAGGWGEATARAGTETLTAAMARSRTMALVGDRVLGQAPLKITGLKVTPIALPDPPLLHAGGCHATPLSSIFLTH